MHSITLYYIPGSAQCRCVLLTGAALNIDFDLKINSTYYLVPTISDGNFFLSGSRVISTYLAEKYDERVEFNLFPNVPEIRAKINMILNFDMETLYTAFLNYYYPVIFREENFDPTEYKKIKEAFMIFNTFLESMDKMGEENLYAAADWLTIADLALAASVSTFIVCGFHIESYPFVEKWYNTVKKMPNFEKANIIPLGQFKHLFDMALAVRARGEIEQ